MSLVEHKDFKKYVKPGSVIATDFDSTDDVRFHLIINPHYNLVYVTAYSKSIKMGNVIFLHRGGYTPENGLLFEHLEKNKVCKILEGVKKMRDNDFKSSEMIHLLAQNLDVNESRFLELIYSNAYSHLQKSLHPNNSKNGPAGI